MLGIKGVALRNMKFPSTAYDDPQVGITEVFFFFFF